MHGAQGKLVVQKVPLYLKSSAQETDVSVVHKGALVGVCVCMINRHPYRENVENI